MRSDELSIVEPPYARCSSIGHWFTNGSDILTEQSLNSSTQKQSPNPSSFGAVFDQVK